VARQAVNPTRRPAHASSGAARVRHAGGAEAVHLDPVIHERVRLAIISALAVNDLLSFNDLKGLLQITDGNLSVHARKLEDAGYVRCTKSFVRRQPRTEFKLTASGRRAFDAYLERMETVIRQARQG